MTRVIAHRGASGYELENTLAAFWRASEMGADGVELDVHATVDGKIVVHHDAEINDSPIRDLRLEELQDFVLANGERIPTLVEALEVIEGTAYVEVKALGASNTEAFFRAIESAGGRDVGLPHIHSFEHKLIVSLRDKRPDLTYGVLSVASRMHPEHLWRETGATEIWQDEQFIDQVMIDLAHVDGCEVFAWTTDKPDRMIELRDMGVDAICTNKPDIARQCLT